MPNAVNNKNTKQASTASMSKHRLAEISHHFLSDENERTPAWKNTSIIPVLLSSKHDDYIVYELDRAFSRNDSRSLVLNIENSLTTMDISSSILDGHPDTLLSGNTLLSDNKGQTAKENGSTEGRMPDICLIPVTSPSTTVALQCDHFIIAVHASLRGVRIAYDQLSFMASLNTDFNVCVIMLGAKNMHDAKRFFGFLCDSAQYLLALSLECGGIILNNNDNSQTAKDEVAQQAMDNLGIATDLEGVAEGILLKFNATKKHALASPLLPPAGPAALLSY